MGERAGVIVIRVTAPPVDGKANAALIAFVAERCGVPRSAVAIVRGQSAREKVVRIAGLTTDRARAALLRADCA